MLYTGAFKIEMGQRITFNNQLSAHYSINIILNPNQKDAVIKCPRLNQMPSSNLYTLFMFVLAPGSNKAKQVRLSGSSSQTKHRNTAWPAVSGFRLGFHQPGQACEHAYASLFTAVRHLHN